MVIVGSLGVDVHSWSVAEFIIAIKFWRWRLILLATLSTLASLSSLDLLLAIFVEKAVVINLVELNFSEIFV